MNNADINASLFKAVTHMNKVFILLVCELSALVIFIRQNAKDGYMTVNGKKAKIVGRICMDQTMLDVTDIEDVKTGDEVVVFGTGENGEPTADSLAENTGTINYETVCLVGKRVPRIYIKDGKIENVMYKL